MKGAVSALKWTLNHNIAITMSDVIEVQGPPLLAQFNFIPSMDK